MATLKKTLYTVLKIGITFLVIILLVNRLGLKNIIATVCSARPSWLLVSCVTFLASTIIGVYQWQILLKNRGIPLAFRRSLRLYMIGMFFNNFLLGGIFGDFLKIASIRSQDGKGKAGLAATFLDRFAGLWAMSGFAVIGSIILLYRGTFSNGKIVTAQIALFGTFILFAGILIFLMFKPVQNFFFFILDRLPLSGKLRLHEIISEMLIEAHDRHILVNVGLLSTLIQFLRIGVHILVACSLGLLSIDNFQYFFIFVPIIAMLMTIPLPFGVREAFGGALFSLAGFHEQSSYVMGFLATLVGLATSAIGGLFYIMDRTVSSKDKNDQSLNSDSAS